MAQNRQGQSSFGFAVGYGFDSENPTLGVDYRYCVTDEFRLGPSFTYLVKNHGFDAWMLDVNAHYLVQLSDMFSFYPLGGVSLSRWAGDFTRFGLNIGLGGEVYATDKISVGLEVKYNIIKDIDQALVGVRVGYNF